MLYTLDEIGANIARYPVTLVNEMDQQVIAERYTYCIPPTIAAADRRHSVYTCDETTGVCSFSELRMAPSVEAHAYPLFVLAGYPRMLIHESLRQRWQAAEIEGWQAYPLDTISDMIQAGPTKMEIERRLQHAPTNGRLWACLARMYRVLGHIERARLAYEQAISLIDYSVSVWQAVGELYTEMGRWHGAKRAYENGLSLIHAPLPLFWSGYSQVLLALHHDDEALLAARQAIHPNLINGEPWYQLARVLHKKGDNEAAAQALKEAIQRANLPNNTLYLVIGQEWELLGRPDEALVAYERGLQRMGGSDLMLLQAVKRLMESRGNSERLAQIEMKIQIKQTYIADQLKVFDKSFVDEEEQETTPSL